MCSEQKTKPKRRLGYFDYDVILGIDFGNTWTKYCAFRTKEGQARDINLYKASTCLYSCENNDYDNAIFEGWGDQIEASRKREELSNAYYINNLLDKVEDLYKTEPDITKPLETALDRLYKRAVIRFFKELIEHSSNYIIQNGFGGESIEMRYVVTYPSAWNPDKAAYLKSLVQMAGVVDEHDHPDRLVMCNEAEATFCYLQEPYKLGTQIKQGQKYLICDLGGTKVKMSLYDIKEPLDTVDSINKISRCDWNLDFVEQPFELDLGGRDITQQVLSLLLSKLSTNSREVSLDDFRHGGYLYDDRGSFEKLTWGIFRDIESDWEEKITKNEPYCITLQSDQQVLPTPENLKDSDTSLDEIHCARNGVLPPEKTSFKFYPREIDNKVIAPLYNNIIQFIERIIRTARVAIDGITFVGGLTNNQQIIDLVEDACNRTGMKYFIERQYFIEKGAVLKFVAEVGAREFKPEIVFDNALSQTSQTNDVYVFIDYGLDATRVSYSPVQSGIADSAKIEHIMNWPGQPIANFCLSTLDIMLIPSDRQLEYSDKRIISMENRTDHNAEYLKCTRELYDGYEYYTFERDELGILLVIHCRSKIEKDANLGMEDQNNFDGYAITTTKKRISAQEFTLLYFEHLTEYIYDLVKSKTDDEVDRFRFCITRDSQAYPDEFSLSDEDIYKIAHKCNMISTDGPNTLLVLECVQATAIYCRTLIDNSTLKKGESYLHFLQVHLHPDRCVLILNDVPISDDKENNINRENGKPWESICKYPKTKNISINIMDFISEYLWNHVQKHQNALLQKCGRHASSTKYFNLSNMQVFKQILYKHITMKTLDIENSELEHEINICDSGNRGYCRLRIANMDLVEYGVVPAINQLVSLIQASVLNQDLFQGKQISNIFVMGEFLDCQDHASYSFLEQLMLSKIRKIQFRRLDNLIIQNSIKKVKVTKINGQEKQQVGQIYNIVKTFKSIEVASMNGSILYGLDPRNRLVERFADKSYAIQNAGIFHKSELIPIIRKGDTLASSPSFINIVVYSLHDLFDKYYFVICIAETDNDSSLDLNTIYDKFEFFDVIYDIQSAFPILIKAQMLQDSSYKFWVEYGLNEKKYFRPLKERIRLKSFHHYK